MAKRIGDFAEAKNKKTKVDDGMDDLWNDSNIDNIDECLVLATQACEQAITINSQRSSARTSCNISNYSNIFECSSMNMYTSTQVVDNNKNAKLPNIMHAATNNNSGYNRTAINSASLMNKDQDNEMKRLETEIKALRERCECKDGEVSILRTQLKAVKHNLQEEHQKKENEWLEKIDISHREILAIKSQLDFKNLEVLNLKNKLLEVSKAQTANNLIEHNHQDSNVDNSAQISNGKGVKLYTIPDTGYPLTDISRKMLYCGISEPHCSVNHQMVANGQDIFPKYKHISESKRYKIEDIVFAITDLTGGTSKSSTIEQSSSRAHQIISTSKHFLSVFHNYLVIQEYYMLNKKGQNYMIQREQLEIPVSSSVCDSRWSRYNTDIGRTAAQVVRIVAAALPYVYPLRKILSSRVDTEGLDFLDDIKKIVHLIMRTNKTQILFSEFLCAVAELLFKMSQTEDLFTKCSSFIFDVSKELLEKRLPSVVLRKLLLFFKQASLDAEFLNGMCKRFQSSLETHAENILVKDDSCLLQSFITVLSQNRTIEEVLPFNISARVNVLQLITVLLNHNNHWSFQSQDDTSHNCVCKLIVLGINIMYDLVNNYQKRKFSGIDDNNDKREYTAAFRYCIKFLHIVGFKYFDTINKYFVDSQYRFIINYLYLSRNDLELTEFEDEALRELYMQEDACRINSANFDKVPIWS